MKGMSLIVKTVTRWVKVFVFLFGVYVVITGHLTPGGGFAGGVIIACSYVLLVLAFGKDFALGRAGSRVASGLDSVGALLFLAVAVGGLSGGGLFFANWLQRRYPAQGIRLLSAGTIPISNIAVGLKVASSLLMIFVILSVLRIVVEADGSLGMHNPEEEE
jgi:multicomponent Na+:H+ antiporter subunit B